MYPLIAPLIIAPLISVKTVVNAAEHYDLNRSSYILAISKRGGAESDSAKELLADLLTRAEGDARDMNGKRRFGSIFPQSIPQLGTVDENRDFVLFDIANAQRQIGAMASCRATLRRLAIRQVTRRNENSLYRFIAGDTLQLMTEIGDGDRALELARTFNGLDKKSAIGSVAAGFAKRGDVELALELSSSEGDRFIAYPAIAEQYVTQGEVEKAQEIANKPENILLYRKIQIAIAEKETDLDMLDQSVSTLNSAIEKGNSSDNNFGEYYAKAYGHIASILFKNGKKENYDDVVISFTSRAMRLDDGMERANAFGAFANKQLEFRDYAGAAESFRAEKNVAHTLLDRDSKSLMLHGAALGLAQSGYYSEALSVIDEAIHTPTSKLFAIPNHDELLAEIAVSNAENGRFNETNQIAKKLSGIYLLSVLNAVVNKLITYGDINRATVAAQNINLPWRSSATQSISLALAKNKRFSEALAQAYSIGQYSDRAVCLAQIGRIEASQSDTSSALICLKAADRCTAKATDPLERAQITLDIVTNYTGSN